jgi:ribosomal protein L11 methyltransferase
MKRGPLWKISVPVTPAIEDAVTTLLGEVLGVPISVYQDVRTGRALASGYLDDPTAWSEAVRARLEAALALLARGGLARVTPRLRAERLRREDWAESWKRHFKPMEFGQALLVKPSWSRRRPKRSQQVVVLDPGLSFGTGQHPTTRFCLEQVVAQRPVPGGEPRSLLDMGTGSGILAIAAVRLGYRPVEAFDFDPDAVRIAAENAQVNGVRRPLHLACRDLTALPKKSVQKHDVVCANLMADLLIQERDRILARLRPGGTLVLAGILARQFPDVLRAYAKTGLRLVASRRENEWKSGALVAR